MQATTKKSFIHFCKCRQCKNAKRRRAKYLKRKNVIKKFRAMRKNIDNELEGIGFYIS